MDVTPGTPSGSGCAAPEIAQSRCPQHSTTPILGLASLQPAVREKILATPWNFFFFIKSNGLVLSAALSSGAISTH